MDEKSARDTEVCEQIILRAVTDSQLLDTQESLSCLGHSVSLINQRHTNGQEPTTRDLFEARSKISSVQRLDHSKGIV